MSTKDILKGLLQNKNFDAVVELAKSDRAVVRQLTSLLYNEDNLLHWRAVNAFGVLAAHPEVLDENKAHVVIGRLLYNLEDQSGGNAWGSMEAIGAIVAAQPYKLGSFVPKMFAKISDSRVWVGLLWSVRQIGEKRPELFKNYVFHVLGLLRNPRISVRGHAAWALGAIGEAGTTVLEGLVFDVRESLEGLLKDHHRINIYTDGELQEKAISDIAKEALAVLKERQG
ncbi:MAG: HEAT repeat domain-containing protein [Firmicutes bacterium]|nr:HEAT repeat domain-containing protein [Bacillota bacterium]